jgi:4-hydroxy-tetrahydrodipicolinate synthase
MKDLGQLITAMVTPFDENLQVDYPRAEALARMLVENGSDGILVVGTTGESPTLTHAEKLDLFRTVRNAVGPSVPVIAGTGSNNTRDSIVLTREAQEIGADAALVVCPYYNKPSQEGIFQHFKAVAEAVSIPIIVYNIQGRTGVNITPETMERLSRIPNIVADKEASGNVEQCSQIVIKTGAAAAFARHCRAAVAVGATGGAGEESRRSFAVYSGDDSLTLPMLSVGAVGVISVASHVAGPQMKEMISAFFQGDVERAMNIHSRLMPLFKGLFRVTNPTLTKTALKLKGFDPGGFRLPLVPPTPQEEKTLREDMELAGIL